MVRQKKRPALPRGKAGVIRPGAGFNPAASTLGFHLKASGATESAKSDADKEKRPTGSRWPFFYRRSGYASKPRRDTGATIRPA